MENHYTFCPIFGPSNETPIGYPLSKCKPGRYRKIEESRESIIDLTIQTSRVDEMKNPESSPCDSIEKTLRTICKLTRYSRFFEEVVIF